jgi:hypothetical protein
MARELAFHTDDVQVAADELRAFIADIDAS